MKTRQITVLRAQHQTHNLQPEAAHVSNGRDAITLHMQGGDTVVLSRVELEEALRHERT